MHTDYEYGDEPLPVGTWVEYFGSLGSGKFRITVHSDPVDHPHLRFRMAKYPEAAEELEAEFVENYPDGVAYTLWPLGVPVKFGNRDQKITGVRRTSFRAIKGEGK